MEKIKFRRCEVDDDGNVHKIYLVDAGSVSVSDVEDPEIYAGAAIWDWQQTDKGKFIMEHGINPTFNRFIDHSRFCYVYKITAELKEEYASMFLLKYGEK